MPSESLTEVEQAARKVAEWIARRDAAIVRARADGASLRVIANAAGLTHQTVANICNR